MWVLCQTLSNMLWRFSNLNALPVPLLRQVYFGPIFCAQASQTVTFSWKLASGGSLNPFYNLRSPFWSTLGASGSLFELPGALKPRKTIKNQRKTMVFEVSTKPHLEVFCALFGRPRPPFGCPKAARRLPKGTQSPPQTPQELPLEAHFEVFWLTPDNWGGEGAIPEPSRYPRSLRGYPPGRKWPQKDALGHLKTST